MLLTEEEAQKKRCPYRHGTGTEQDGISRSVVWVSFYRCYASECMAWRWAYDDEYDGIVKKGFCGLAGRVME